MVMEQEDLKVVQGEEVKSTEVEVVHIPGVTVDTRREGLRLKEVKIPFVGKTPTGGESTKFLPRFSKDFFKLNPVNLHSVNLSQVNLNPVKPLSVDSIQVNPYPVPQGWTGAKDTISDSSQPRTVRNRSSYQARRGVEQRNRRLRRPTGRQRCQVTTDRQASGKASLQSGTG